MVCLGLLTFGEATGYDLKKKFECSFGHFFSAGFGSIYPALAYLAKTNLVTCHEEHHDGKPDRKVYQITDQGRQRFLGALQQSEPSHKIRSEFLAMLYFAHLMPGEQIETILDHRLGEIEKLAQMLGQLECDVCGELPTGVRFVAGFGLAMVTAARKYIEENRHLLTQADAEQKRKVASA